MDFFEVIPFETRGKIEARPEFVVDKTKDLMVRGGAFYAIWDAEKGLWSTSEYELRRIVDDAIRAYVEKAKEDGIICTPKYLRHFSNGGWKQFKQYVKSLSDNSHDLDTRMIFAGAKTKKSDYATKRLPYNPAPGSIAVYEELIDLLYAPEQREKFEWYIGAILHGAAHTKEIQKFLVFYGSPGSGKSTVMDIATAIFGGELEDGGYVATFDAKSLVNGNQFGTEAFRTNPLVAIQHDGDLSKIEENARLNSIISRERIMINEKFKPQYESTVRTALFMGTNLPVRISDRKSGMIRRLIDVKPTGNRHTYDDYMRLTKQVLFEVPAIAHHCMAVYKRLGPSHYAKYEPTEMIMATDYFRNFVEHHYDIFKEQDSTTLKQSFAMFKEYANEAQLDFKLKQYHFRDKLRDYFDEFHTKILVDGAWKSSYYKGFNLPAMNVTEDESGPKFVISLEETTSLLDEMLADETAQYANSRGFPQKYWNGEDKIKNGKVYTPKPDEIVSTKLSDLDTTRLHYVRVPENMIVIDFDLKDEDGNKSLELNLEAATNWPTTYTEISQGGHGVHLHYFWDGDVTELSSKHSPGIEVKTLLGDAALRRRLSKCNNAPVATISTGLYLKEKPLQSPTVMKSERGLRNLLIRCLTKDIQDGTKPNMDFIAHILNRAYDSGMVYNVQDMESAIIDFAGRSTNHALYCLKIAQNLPLKSEHDAEEAGLVTTQPESNQIVFFDIEVYPNLVLVCWKYQGSSDVVPMINPTADQIETLLKFRLIGFNNIGYDNHILWAILMGYTTEQIYELSQKLVSKDKSRSRNAKFQEAYNISYADIFDFATVKQGLKKWEIELGIPHVEMDIPWDEPVPKEKLQQVIDYCCNDVKAAEFVFDHNEQDWNARLILADLSGLTPNHSVRHHVTKLIFGDNRNPQSEFNFPDLSKEFPGYKFDPFSTTEKSTYRGEVVGEGGYVYAEPGMYENVLVLDVASMHPSTIARTNYFGPYTKTYVDIMNARLAIKDAASAFEKGEDQKGDELLEQARGMFDGRLKPYLKTRDPKKLKALADALKLVINSTYGFTCAGFDNPFRHERNAENVIAKRGALFMIDLKHALQEKGVDVIHIKTDSIKLADPSEETVAFVLDFGKKYGYEFKVEDTYKKFCLVNQAVYIAKKDNGKWDATGAQFQHPYVFKMLFSREPVEFKDLCETKSVSNGGVMYLDFNSNMYHVGKVGSFVPVNDGVEGLTGGHLIRKSDEGKFTSVTGTKDYLWLESEMLKELKFDSIDRLVFEGLAGALEGTGSIADVIDLTYFENLASAAKESIEKFGDFEEFVA